jgi:hypothetical protein
MIIPSQNQEKKLICDTSTGEILKENSSLPCLYSNNSIENTDFKSNRLSSSQKKSAIALSWNVEYMAETYGLNKIGFLTLTFPFKVTCMKNAQRLYNSFQTNYLSTLFDASICVKERHKNNSIHFHLLVACRCDIRTGVNFSEISQGKYSSAAPQLRILWSKLRRNAPKYKFGRTELLPVKSTAEGISRYVGKYISKNVQNRPEADKGTRLVNYSKNSRNTNTRFMVLNQGSENWRRKVKIFCKLIEKAKGLPPLNPDNISKYLGIRWAYEWREFILELPDSPQKPKETTK